MRRSLQRETFICDKLDAALSSNRFNSSQGRNRERPGRLVANTWDFFTFHNSKRRITRVSNAHRVRFDRRRAREATLNKARLENLWSVRQSFSATSVPWPSAPSFRTPATSCSRTSGAPVTATGRPRASDTRWVSYRRCGPRRSWTTGTRFWHGSGLSASYRELNFTSFFKVHLQIPSCITNSRLYLSKWKASVPLISSRCCFVASTIFESKW